MDVLLGPLWNCFYSTWSICICGEAMAFLNAKSTDAHAHSNSLYAFDEWLTKAERLLQLFQYVRIVRSECLCHSPHCLTLSIIWNTLLLSAWLKVKVLIIPALVQFVIRNENFFFYFDKKPFSSSGNEALHRLQYLSRWLHPAAMVLFH